MKHSKQKIINEILRFDRILTQCKYGSEDDKNIKKLIAENLAQLSEIESHNALKKQAKHRQDYLANLAACS